MPQQRSTVPLPRSSRSPGCCTARRLSCPSPETSFGESHLEEKHSRRPRFKLDPNEWLAIEADAEEEVSRELRF